MTKNIIEVLDECLSQQDRQDPTHVDLIHVLIRKTIDYIGKEVVCLGEIVNLSWRHVEPYLKTYLRDGQDLYYQIDYAFCNLWSRSPRVYSEGLQSLIFKGEHEQISVAYIDFLNTILLLRNTEYPKVLDGEVVLTEDQLFFCRRFATDQSGKIVLRNVNNLLNHDMLLKTLRADEYDFSHQFILGIIPGENGARRLHNLRPSRRKDFVITPRGNIAPRLNKQPMYTPEQKKGFSQIQSCTLIDVEAFSPAFGFTKDRNSKLYGLMTDSKDALISRLLLDDSGTVSRIFDCINVSVAKHSQSYIAYADGDKKHFYSINELDGFKAKNNKQRLVCGRTNEVLARLRFNPYRSVVSICSDTLEARLLAYDFAQELLEHYAGFAEKNGATLNPKFQLPIVFYVKKAADSEADSMNALKHEIKLYTDEMRQKDVADASARYNNDVLRHQHYDCRNYEFLLGLPVMTLEILLERLPWNSETCNEIPLALLMMRKGYVRMLMRLLRVPPRTENTVNDDRKRNLRDELVNSLLQSGYIKQNDPVISQLILAEQFELADRFIAATKSDKYKLPHSHGLLFDHLRQYGNPRQIQYAGFEALFFVNARENGASFNLYVKEYPELCQSLLGKLLPTACRRSDTNTVDFLLKWGANTATSCIASAGETTKVSAKIDAMAPISIAARFNNWTLVFLFTYYPADAEDRSEYGYALLAAIRDGQIGLAKLLLQAGAKATWRHSCHHDGYELQSTLWYAIERGFDELLPLLIEHEKTYHDGYSRARFELALELAYEKGNQDAIDLLQQNFGLDSLNVEASICRHVLYALAVEGSSFKAEKRLLSYCQQYRLLGNDHHQVTSVQWRLASLFQLKLSASHDSLVKQALYVIMPYLSTELSLFPTRSVADRVLKRTVKWLLQYKEPSFFGFITDLPCVDNKLVINDIGRIVFDIFVENLSSATMTLVRDIISLHFATGFWQELWEKTLFNWIESKRGSMPFEEDENKALLLFELHPMIPDDLVSIIFGCALSRKKMSIAEKLLAMPNLSEPTKESMLTRAIEYEFLISDSRVLLMIKNNFNVKMAHVRRISARRSVGLLLEVLDIMGKNKLDDEDDQSDYFAVFLHHSFKNLKIATKLVDLLGPLMVRHFSLISLLVMLKYTITFTYSKSRWPNLLRYINKNSLELNWHNTFRLENTVQINEYHAQMLIALDIYLADVGAVQNESLIVNTYNKILGIIESMANAHPVYPLRFFSRKPPEVSYDIDIYLYMKQLDELLMVSQADLLPVDAEQQHSLGSAFPWVEAYGFPPIF